MGRSRGPQASSNDDFSQRSKRKRAALTGENSDSTTAVYPTMYNSKVPIRKILVTGVMCGQGSSDGKRALYHCNYCNKDITGKIRIKCAICPDFDLCVECFSVGAEVYPHKGNHPYRVMDNLSFPLICPDWNADEEMLLLEGLEMYGMGNWAEVAEHVGTKSKDQCIDHYTTTYLESPCFPLPDMSHVVGKSRTELVAMAKEQSDGKKKFPALGELTLKEEPTFLPSRVNVEEAAVGRSPSRLTADPQLDRSVGENKPKSSGDEGPSMAELSGYNPKRQEFDLEYDNDAEQLLADMEFKDTDTQAEHELKLRMLHIYGKRIDERKRRKDFILERNLLHPHPIEKDLSPEEKEIFDRYKVFMRFQSKEEHDDLIQTVIEEHRTRKRIQELQEARDAGCRTSAEADRYLELKRRTREAEENARKGKDNSHQAGPSSKAHQKGVTLPKRELDVSSPQGGAKGSSSSEAGGKDQTSTRVGSASSSSLDVWNITGLPGSDLLSESEKRLCGEIKLLPSHYLKMLEVISIEIMKGSLTKKSDAHSLFNMDPSKVDRVYEMLVKKGIAPPPP